ncbi:MAG: hypothetical protein KGQ47_13115 [Hyphomicrobiales bacterium]|nr:hypothetical protein [Hyphomicrobiales bacterium]
MSCAFPSRRSAAAAVSLLIAAAWLFPAADARAAGLFGSCNDAGQVAMLPAPLSPWKGAPLRVLVTADKPLDGELSLIAPDGSIAAKSGVRHGGPPYYWFAEVAAPAPGMWQAKLATSGCSAITHQIAVHDNPPPRPPSAAGSIWPLRANWNRANEDLFSAWIAKLFDAPLDTEPSWKALHEVLRDRSRNMLINYLGRGEDNARMALRPDCADLVYFLRAYFAYKMGLPFGYGKCSRGKPPRCYGWFTNVNPDPSRPGQNASFGEYLRVVADAVQSGAVRVRANDDNTDFYTVPLTQETLRPGTVYADPYGHVMMLVRRVPEQGGAAGVFLSVDGEPDGTVARKRFWRGNFLFAHEPSLGSPGFKRFRPIVREANGGLRRLTNAEIAKDPNYGDFSLEQSQLSVEDFYDRMDEVMSPEPLDPLRAMKGAIDSLEEQVKTRVGSIENGRKFQNSGKGEAAMPDGAAIFATTGAWEDFATPARDFRLLIAIDVVRGYPDRVARKPGRYAMPAGKSVAEVKAELQSALAAELSSRKFSYTRSDGSQWTLTLKDVIDRAVDFEMGYNLNDCVELRWGAPSGSQEASTCKRHAPAAQRAKMTDYRSWFRTRHWPTGA